MAKKYEVGFCTRIVNYLAGLLCAGGGLAAAYLSGAVDELGKRSETISGIVKVIREIAYAIACNKDGYVPTHNQRFCQPLTGDEKKDFLGNRTKRVFSDPVGKRCGSHELPFLLQTYRRDTGEIMHDISAPVYVKGRHWGGVRIGYRTE